MSSSSNNIWISANQWIDEVHENWPKITELIADYYKDNLDVSSPVTITEAQKPGEVAKLFDDTLAEDGAPLDDILEDVKTKVFKNCNQWQHPNFLAWYPANTPPTAGMAEALISAVGAVGLQ